MTAQLKSVQKTAKHFQDILNTFNYQTATVVPVYGESNIAIFIGATSPNPIGKLCVQGRYNILHDYFYIDAINFGTSSEDLFFQTMKTLHNTITNIQTGIDSNNGY